MRVFEVRHVFFVPVAHFICGSEGNSLHQGCMNRYVCIVPLCATHSLSTPTQYLLATPFFCARLRLLSAISRKAAASKPFASSIGVHRARAVPHGSEFGKDLASWAGGRTRPSDPRFALLISNDAATGTLDKLNPLGPLAAHSWRRFRSVNTASGAGTLTS